MNAVLARHQARMAKRHLYSWDAGNRCWNILNPETLGAGVIAILPVETDPNGTRASLICDALDKATKQGLIP